MHLLFSLIKIVLERDSVSYKSLLYYCVVLANGIIAWMMFTCNVFGLKELWEVPLQA